MEKKSRRIAIAAAATVASLFGVMDASYGQQYPVKPVRVIVPFAPGGGSDITARQFSQKLSEALGQQFLVDNRGGAAGLIGMELTAKAPPDGYTLMTSAGGLVPLMCVPQRHRFAFIWRRMSAFEGAGFASSSACARIIIPGMQ